MKMKSLISFFSCIFLLTGSCCFAENLPTVQTCENKIANQVFFSYAQALQATRDQGKSCLFVLFDPEPTHPSTFSDFVAYAEEWSTLGSNVVVLCPTGICILIYPPKPDPMIAEIKAFQEALAYEELPKTGSWLITVNIDNGMEFIECMHPVEPYLNKDRAFPEE